MSRREYKPDRPLTVGRKWLLTLTALAVVFGGVGLLTITPNIKISADVTSADSNAMSTSIATYRADDKEEGKPTTTINVFPGAVKDTMEYRYHIPAPANSTVSNIRIRLGDSYEISKNTESYSGQSGGYSADRPLTAEGRGGYRNGTATIPSSGLQEAAGKSDFKGISISYDIVDSDGKTISVTKKLVNDDGTEVTKENIEESVQSGASAQAPDTETDGFQRCVSAFGEKGGMAWVAGEVLCGLASTIGKGLSKAILTAFDIEKLTQNRSLYSLEGAAATEGGHGWAYVVWNVLIKLTDIVAIIILIIVAFANILHINLNIYSVKKMLPTFIGALLAAHLSWFLIKILFDFSNIIVPTAWTAKIVDGIKQMTQGVGAVILAMFSSIFTIAQWPLILPVFIIVFIGLFLTMFALGMMLSFQPTIIGILAMVAPIAIMLAVLPSTQPTFQKWLKITTNWLAMWPLTMFVLFLISLVAKQINAGKIWMKLADLTSGTALVSGGVGAGLVDAISYLAPMLVCAALLVLAIRIPFTLGKDAVALVNAVKSGGQAFIQLGRGAAGAAVGGVQRAKEFTGGAHDKIKGWRSRDISREVTAGAAKAEARAGATGRADYLAKLQRGALGRTWEYREKARIAGEFLKEDSVKAQARQHEAAEMKYNEDIAEIEKRQLPPKERDAARKEARETYQEEVGKIHGGVTDPEKLEATIRQKSLKIAQTHGLSIDEFMSSRDSTVIGLREAAERVAVRELLDPKNPDAVDPNAVAGILKARESVTSTEKTTQGEVGKVLRGEVYSTPETSFWGRQGMGIWNTMARWALSPTRALTAAEQAPDTPAEQAAHLKTLRRETYLGTQVFERLAGRQLAGKTVVNEYAEKYRYWQYPELLQEVRRLRLNLSPAQIESIIQQSPRKAWPMAASLGYRGGLDNFSKLYMASNYMKSAGRSWGARATFEEMLTTGQTAQEIERRMRLSRQAGGGLPAEGGFADDERTLERFSQAIDSDKDPSSVQTVKLQNQSAKILSALLGTGVGEATAREMVTVLGPHLGKVRPEQFETVERIGSDTSLTSDQKIARMITELRGTARGVGSLDVSMSLTSVGEAARAWQAYRKTNGAEVSIAQAQHELQDRAMKKINKQVGAAPSPGKPEAI